MKKPRKPDRRTYMLALWRMMSGNPHTAYSASKLLAVSVPTASSLLRELCNKGYAQMIVSNHRSNTKKHIFTVIAPIPYRLQQESTYSVLAIMTYILEKQDWKDGK